MPTKQQIAEHFATAFLAGDWSRKDLLRRGRQLYGRRSAWLARLVTAVLAAFPTRPERRDAEWLAPFIETDPDFGKGWSGRSWQQFGASWLPHQYFWVTPTMAPAPGQPESWVVPALPTSAALADWLGIDLPHLNWFADCHGREADLPVGPLRHYTYRWIAKKSGSWRLLETPKSRLKALQRRLLHELLDRISPHAAVHGYCRGRSIATFAAPHCGRRIVLRFDLRDFFPSVRDSRVHALFRTAGYPRQVARLLTGLCTNIVPDDIWPSGPLPTDRPVSWQERKPYQVQHLPQGAPTSPALANLCAYRLDCRLNGLAQAVGGRYTRYADDLAISGDEDLERSARRLQVEVCRIALEEGFEVHTRKSRFMRQCVRQQLVGVVVNSHPNLCRTKYDRLKAILHNCVRHGPGSQNREGHANFRAHLLGQVAHVAMLNEHRGRRLRSLFDKIDWEHISDT